MRKLGRFALLAGALAVASSGLAAIPAASASTGQTVTYTATVTIPAPPASNYAGSAGGDGWAVAMTPAHVYNVFHHQGSLLVACHLQTNASACWAPKTIADTQGNGFATSGQPGLYINQANGHLYLFATRTSDSTAGVVCIDTTAPASTVDPFCGFTALTGVGNAALSSGTAGDSDPVIVNNNWYAFNYVNGVSTTGANNHLMCFSLSTFTACPGQPYSVNIGAGTVANSGFPSPSIANIGNQIIVPISLNNFATSELACINASTHAACAGWPVSTTSLGYPQPSNSGTGGGAPFPMLNSQGVPTGVCLPIASAPCFSLAGASVTSPTGLATAVAPNPGWDGTSIVLGPRVYVPDGNYNGNQTDRVACYDYSRHASCTNFPKTFPTLSLLYTVNRDPQRPSCIWVNSDGGTDQIQNFDAFTGGACGHGSIRVVAANVVAPLAQCVPLSYKSLQVTVPARNKYTSGSVEFENNDAQPLPIPNKSLDATGAVSLTGLTLNTPGGLPQFVITLVNPPATLGQVVVKLVWTGTYDSACVLPGTTVTGLTTTLGNGLMMLGGDGGMFAFGSHNFVGAANFGGTPGPLTTPLGQVIPTPFTALAETPDHNGFFDVLGNGQLFPVGSAKSYGDLTGVRLAGPIAGIAATPDGKGYWMVGTDGGVFRFGDATFHGSLGSVHLAAPIVAIVATRDGGGYWLIGKDGGVFSFGDATFHGSLGNLHLAAPITGATRSFGGNGYLLVGADGGVFRFGDATFHGSSAGIHLAAPMVAIALTDSGNGYWEIGGDGGVFTHGDAPFQGSLPAVGFHLRAPIVGAVN